MHAFRGIRTTNQSEELEIQYDIRVSAIITHFDMTYAFREHMLGFAIQGCKVCFQPVAKTSQRFAYNITIVNEVFLFTVVAFTSFLYKCRLFNKF